MEAGAGHESVHLCETPFARTGSFTPSLIRQRTLCFNSASALARRHGRTKEFSVCKTNRDRIGATGAFLFEAMRPF